MNEVMERMKYWRNSCFLCFFASSNGCMSVQLLRAALSMYYSAITFAIFLQIRWDEDKEGYIIARPLHTPRTQTPLKCWTMFWMIWKNSTVRESSLNVPCQPHHLIIFYLHWSLIRQTEIYASNPMLSLCDEKLNQLDNHLLLKKRYEDVKWTNKVQKGKEMKSPTHAFTRHGLPWLKMNGIMSNLV